ncbi:MAG: endonuclease/exonuclease/phosphatase family protein [Gammaproteobacteria bacterium]|nr:endonuclease/exonuclease/phosphatase family protein [Gammaproteobacteria bacterium]
MIRLHSKSLVCLVAVALACGCAGIERRVVPVVQETGYQQAFDFQPVSLRNTYLTVATLNVAHGRRDGIHQLFQGTRRHLRNLDAISMVLSRERPHVAALQEADGPSVWSGGFSHVAYLAESGGFGYYVRGEHDYFPALSHGTAIISRLRLRDPLAVTFRRTTVAMPKGFVVATVAWPGRPDLLVDVVSVHLDFLNVRVRERQITELMQVIESRARPLVLMGDFNSVWNGRRKLLRRLVEEFGLSTHEPESQSLATHALFDRRLDWIFVSSELDFRSYETLTDVVSDHRAVKARISVRPVPRSRVTALSL